MTDNQILLNHLKTGEPITAVEAIHKLGIYNARSRISNLVDQGHKIERDWMEVVRHDGKVARVRLYWMKTEQDELSELMNGGYYK